MTGRLTILVAVGMTLTGCGDRGASPPAAAPTKTPPTAAPTNATTDGQKAEDKKQQASAPDIDLGTAAAEGDLDAIRQHIAAGSELNKDTPLVTAIVFGNMEAAKLLIEAGADLNAQDAQGSTPVFVAAFFCRAALLKLLLEKGADQSIANQEGRTAVEVVQAPFAAVKPVYEYIELQLGSLGLKLDYERLEKERPAMAEILKAAGE